MSNKVKQWEAARRILKIAFEEAGITRCELGYAGCWRDNGLGFAHVDKRRFLQPGELYKVVLACAVCHPILELLPRRKMRQAIELVIAKRICQPKVTQ